MESKRVFFVAQMVSFGEIQRSVGKCWEEDVLSEYRVCESTVSKTSWWCFLWHVLFPIFRLSTTNFFVVLLHQARPFLIFAVTLGPPVQQNKEPTFLVAHVLLLCFSLGKGSTWTERQGWMGGGFHVRGAPCWRHQRLLWQPGGEL